MFTKFITRLILLAFIIAVVPSVTVVYAQDASEIKYESISPKNGFEYSFKRLREKITLFWLSRDPLRKANYYSELLDKRLAELKQVVDEKDIENIQTVSQRYSATAGELTNLINQKSLGEVKPSVLNKFSQHVFLLESFQKSYVFDTAQWMFIKHDIDYLKIYSSQL